MGLPWPLWFICKSSEYINSNILVGFWFTVPLFFCETNVFFYFICKLKNTNLTCGRSDFWWPNFSHVSSGWSYAVAVDTLYVWQHAVMPLNHRRPLWWAGSPATSFDFHLKSEQKLFSSLDKGSSSFKIQPRGKFLFVVFVM